nr:hypothetical protein CFP56_72916 [Quercus suber]
MGAGVMNSDYESEELLSLNESSSDSAHVDASSDDDNPFVEVDTSTNRSRFPIFMLVAKAEHLRFEKDMMFISPKQFNEAIIDFAVHGGWGIRFVKNDLLRVRARYQPGCKFVAYLAKVPREKSYREDAEKYVNDCYKNSTYIVCYEPLIDLINGQNMWRPSRLPPVQPPIKRRPSRRPKKKRAQEPDEPRSHRKNRGIGMSKQCKACGKLGHNRRSCKEEAGGNFSLPGSANQARRTTRRATRDGNERTLVAKIPTSNVEPSVQSAPPTIPPNVFTSAPPPLVNTQPNPRQNRRAVTFEIVNATRNAARYMEAVRFAGSPSSGHVPGR